MLPIMVQHTPFSVRLFRYAVRLAIQLPIFIVFSVLYYPLLMLCDKNEFVREYVNAYINWWIL
jgi:hypothetical protein